MLTRISLSALIILLALANTAYAHGEDEPGPHNGYIKMPGAYHIEVIPAKHAVDIMLLDVNFKNPTVLNSHIKAKVKTGDQTYTLKCESMDNYFSCPLHEKMLSNKGTLIIESERQLAEGTPVEYPLPLRLEKTNI
jgi:hypothetical protein